MLLNIHYGRTAGERTGSKGRAKLFLVSKQNLNPPIGAFGALKFVKNRLELRKKVMALSRGSQELIKTNRQKSPNT